MDYARPPQGDSWFAPFSVDLLVKVLKTTFLHPFICWLVPVCLRAQTMKYDAPPMLATVAWAVFITLCWAASRLNQRIAHGLPRHVDLGDEVIVITGGASGLGLLIAEVYGMRGAAVAVLDINDMESGEARGVTYYRCDVRDKAQVAKVALDIERDLGTPTVLINNAAIVIGKTLLDMTLDEIDTSISTNLLAHFYTLKAFLPALLRGPATGEGEGAGKDRGRGGTVVTVSSVMGHLGGAQLTDYAAAKAGVTALHRSLEAELRTQAPQIRCVLVEPGQLSTPLFYGIQSPNAFLAPVVEPVEVARDVIAAIDGGRGAHVAMPLYARWVDWYHVLPASAQLLARKLSGIDVAMKSFIGRSGNRPRGEKHASEESTNQENNDILNRRNNEAQMLGWEPKRHT